MIPELNVLFVGNSQTNWEYSIAQIVEDLSASASEPSPRIRAEDMYMHGAGLEQLWSDGRPKGMIEKGKYDWVVIQEIINVAEETKENFFKHSRLFDQWINQHGAKTLLFVTGQVEGKRPVHAIMYEANLEMARELKCRIAGGGMAWMKAWERDANLDFHAADRAHPNLKGVYLNACVLYAALTDASPLGLSPYKLDVADARRLQEIAWEQARVDRDKENG